jgi:hypothetical protein
MGDVASRAGIVSASVSRSTAVKTSEKAKRRRASVRATTPTTLLLAMFFIGLGVSFSGGSRSGAAIVCYTNNSIQNPAITLPLCDVRIEVL